MRGSMPKPRKTIEVEVVRNFANNYLSLSEDEAVDQRIGISGLLEAVLHESGNYKGFRYLDGMQDVDESRRCYF